MDRQIMNRFSTNPVNLDIARSKFPRNHKKLFSFDVGQLVPFLCEEVLPGDTWSVDTSKVFRVQPMVTPIMDNLYADVFYFFCPMRILWEHTKQFFGENTETAWVPDVEYSIPQLQIPEGGFDVGTIADYIGVPPKAGAGKTVNALQFRAYAEIVNEWFRDENLQTPVHVYKGDTTVIGSNGSDQVIDIEKGGKPFIAAKYHDFFTSALPSAQKGPAVSFSLNGEAPVFPLYDKSVTPFATGKQIAPLGFKKVVAAQYGSGPIGNKGLGINDVSNSTGFLGQSSDSYTQQAGSFVAPSNLWADLGNVSTFSINELRTAFAVQRYYERLARGGSRYTEYIKAFFNVTSPDARLQRPEYLGGNRIPLNVTQVEQTSATESGLTPQGNLTGISHTADLNSDFTKSFTEHGYIIGLCVVRYNHTYQQGIERQFLRKTVFDFYNPVFANLGEQAIKEDEIYFDTNSTGVFGYQEAWAEYRYKPSSCAGEFRSVYPQSLDMWHLADYYTSKPYLSPEWIREDKTMLDRCLAVTSAVSNQILADFYVQATVARPMPLYSIPGLIDHH